MILLALPALSLKLSMEGNDTFPRTIPELQAYDRLTAEFPAEGVAHWVAVRDDSARSGEVAAALEDLARRAHNDPLFARDTAPNIRTSADGRVGTLELAILYGANSSEGSTSLQRLRTQLVPSTIGKLHGAEYAVSGEVARSVDVVNHQAQRMPWVVGFVLLSAFIMMAVAFRSVVIGLVGVVLNILSAAAAFGTVVAVFQHTWAEDLLGFKSAGFIGSRIPLFLFVILFGLSMDYQVFVVSRIRELALRGMPTRKAVFEGITSSAGVVTSAAVVMVSVFASFVFADLLEMKQIGFSLAVAVLLDAFIVRILILPSLMTLLGKASWWPSRAVRQAAPAPENHTGAEPTLRQSVR
jgi:RND superfamily putative drug exporter